MINLFLFFLSPFSIRPYRQGRFLGNLGTFDFLRKLAHLKKWFPALGTVPKILGTTLQSSDKVRLPIARGLIELPFFSASDSCAAARGIPPSLHNLGASFSASVGICDPSTRDCAPPHHSPKVTQDERKIRC